ncbi:Transcription activator AMTR1-like protein [Cladobotryum mycophilum]|uniref:Transcription activator AMTR1-like protein n=1 Tax=Cladobotryum mycophilum TaxID=491253 RepID=A0ABR0SRJ6_9HYPO
MEISTVPCTRCRKRRVKCDKRLPGCERCEKSSQPCPGYNRLRGFLDQGETLRRKLSPSNSHKASTIQSRADGIQSIVDSGGSSQLIVTNLSVEDLGASTNSSASHVPSSDSHIDVPISERMAATNMSDSEFQSLFFDIDPDLYYSDANNCCGFIPGLPTTQSVDFDQPAALDSSSVSEFDRFSMADFSFSMTNLESDESVRALDVPNNETDRETAYLVRYFAERISPCLDVFDVERYFGHVVPTRAIRSALLKNSLAAIAAKSFGKTKRESPAGFLAQTASWSMLEQHCGEARIDWFYKAASFYSKAIGQMMNALQILQGKSTPSSVSNSPAATHLNLHLTTSPSSLRQSHLESRGSEGWAVDDVLAAISVFLLYESLDNRQNEIYRHMSGAQYLLNENLGELRNTVDASVRASNAKRAWQASFWSLACIDWISSYTYENPPRLDPYDSQLWKTAGLPLCVIGGKVKPESLRCVNTPHPQPQVTETIACRTLVWIVLKALIYVTAEKSRSPSIHTPSELSGSESQLPYRPEDWHEIKQYLEDWTAILPDTFEPCLKLGHMKIQAGVQPTAIPDPNPELFYANSLCATSAVLYHFVQLLLLLHKPLGYNNPSELHADFISKRLGAYRQLPALIDRHANQICAISLARPNDPSRFHMVQPLYLAGLCFESSEQKSTLHRILQDIKQETGLSLQSEWDTNIG